MRLRPIHYTTLRDFYFLTVCAGIFVFTATSVLWIYANFFAPKEKSRRLAEEGVFFLRAYASVRTPHGVVGIPAGERVRRVNAKARQDGLLKVTDGQYVFEVPPSGLTDDLDLAESICASDGEAQRLLSEQATSEQWNAQQTRAQYEAARANDAVALSSRIRSASTVGALLTPLNTGVSRVLGSSASAPSYEYYSGVTNNVVINSPTANGANTGGWQSSPSIPNFVRSPDDSKARLHKEAGLDQALAPASY